MRICSAAASASSPAAVPDIDVPQPGEAVDDLAPVGEVQHRALALVDQQRRLVLLGMVQRMDQIAPVAFEQLRGAVHGISSAEFAA